MANLPGGNGANGDPLFSYRWYRTLARRRRFYLLDRPRVFLPFAAAVMSAWVLLVEILR